jgi:PIN domain nuclease of toxin-antitoxin system
MIFADTHIIAWLASGSDLLPPEARSELVDRGFAVSVVTAFEYADLHHRGRLPKNAALGLILAEFGAEVLDLPAELWTIVRDLPPIHRDPVDRMLVAHTIMIDGVIATADANIRDYPVRTLW